MTSPASPLSPAAYDAFMRDVVAEARKRAAAKKTTAAKRWEFRGHNLTAQDNHDDELLLCGPAGSGKTLAHLAYIDRMMRAYPRLRVLLVRKVRIDLAETVMNTYERDILGYDNPICAGATRAHREAYRYPNGSIMMIAGFDRPGRVLSGEYDIVYAAEAKELSLNDWEYLTMRLGRTEAFPYPQLRADTNPDRPDHWILSRKKEGKLTYFDTWHQDNPAYWDANTNDWTPLGVRYSARLQNLSGVRRERYLFNKWVAAEGAIYEAYNEQIHVKDDDWLTEQGWIKWDEARGDYVPGARVVVVRAGQDWGYTHPGDHQVWLKDGDGRVCMVHEVFMTKQTIDWWTDEVLEAKEQWGTRAVECDPSQPAYIKTFRNAGINAVPADNDVLPGIDRVQQRYAVQPDGEPRIYYRRKALKRRDPERDELKLPCGLIEEKTGYVWLDKSKKDEPLKENDDANDTERYALAGIDKSRDVKQSRNPFYGHGGE